MPGEQKIGIDQRIVLLSLGHRFLHWAADAEGLQLMRDVLAAHMSVPGNRDRYTDLVPPEFRGIDANGTDVVVYDEFLLWIRQNGNWG
jgi:hypothetical protein